jgi:serine phosphatase RsbU (regulator of sigma subunit)
MLTLIAYSDGLLEATSPAGKEFGESRLLPVVRGSMRQSAQEVLSHVMEEADRFMEGGRSHDDLTVLIAKLTREPTTPSQPAP